MTALVRYQFPQVCRRGPSGPISFLLYINDLPDNVRLKFALFHEDTAVYLTINSPNDSVNIQKDLDLLQEWEAQWDMDFDPGKCQVLHITRARNPIKSTMHNKTLESVSSVTYLGVDMSTNLDFNIHIDRITSNANKSLGFLSLFIKCNVKKGKRKVQGVPQSQTTALPRPQEEEETDKSKQAQTEQTCKKR